MVRSDTLEFGTVKLILNCHWIWICRIWTYVWYSQ